MGLDMTEIDLSPGAENTVEIRVEDCAERLGLSIQRGTLRSYPGCVHWHFKQPRESGTLEATWWPKGRRLWLKIASNRQADWIAEAVERFRREFEN